MDSLQDFSIEELNTSLKVLDAIIKLQKDYIKDIPNIYDNKEEIDTAETGCHTEIKYAEHFKIYIEDSLEEIE